MFVLTYTPPMGLREKKAKLTRDRIVTEALAMFASSGYAETTMESIAEAAEIHPATLYRYFPSKDLIVFADFESSLDRFSDSLETVPTDVPLPVALMTAMESVLQGARDGHMEGRLLRSIIDQSPAARARVWDLQAEQRRRIAGFLAARTGKSEQDYDIVLSARIAVLLVEAAADIWRESDGGAAQVQIARDLARRLSGDGLILPDPGTADGVSPAASPRGAAAAPRGATLP